MSRRNLYRLGFAVLSLGVATLICPARSYAGGGGGGGGVDTVKVNKCEYAVTTGYVELLVSASSSNKNAVLFAYLPDGTPLGYVFSGGQYGGTVFLCPYVPATITVVSSYGGWSTVPCVPFQP
jgi:hypothetical protein